MVRACCMLLFGSSLLICSSVVIAQPTFNDVVIGDVPTDDGGAYTLHIDIAAATAGSGPRPIVLWIHGGGWQSGTYNQINAAALQLRSRGIHVAGTDYRLSGQAIFPRARRNSTNCATCALVCSPPILPRPMFK